MANTTLTTDQVNKMLKDLFESRRRFEKTLSQKQKREFDRYWSLLQNMPLYSALNAVEDQQMQIERLERELEKAKNKE